MRGFTPSKAAALKFMGVDISVFAPATNVVVNGFVSSPIESILAETTPPLDNLLNDLASSGTVDTTIPSPMFDADFFLSAITTEPFSASVGGFHIVIGLPYAASVETLPIVGAEGRRTNVTSAMFMLGRHENFCVGRVDSLRHVRYGRYFLDALASTSSDRPLQLSPTHTFAPLPNGWDYEGGIFAEAQIGQPLEILQIVLNDSRGDALREDQRDAFGGAGGGADGNSRTVPGDNGR